MSTNLGSFFGESGPDRNVELVTKITQKTRDGKITWHKTQSGLAATISGKLKLNLVEAPSSTLSAPRWIIFSVRDDRGTDVLKVENTSSGVAAGINALSGGGFGSLLGSLGGGTLSDAVTQLHALITARTKGDVERAISMLDDI
jgi:hypothetical protein